MQRTPACRAGAFEQVEAACAYARDVLGLRRVSAPGEARVGTSSRGGRQSSRPAMRGRFCGRGTAYSWLRDNDGAGGGEIGCSALAPGLCQWPDRSWLFEFLRPPSRGMGCESSETTAPPQPPLSERYSTPPCGYVIMMGRAGEIGCSALAVSHASSFTLWIVVNLLLGLAQSRVIVWPRCAKRKRERELFEFELRGAIEVVAYVKMHYRMLGRLGPIYAGLPLCVSCAELHVRRRQLSGEASFEQEKARAGARGGGVPTVQYRRGALA